MIRVKTFSTALKVFHAHEEIEALDAEVNRFIEEAGVVEVVSVSDACTSGAEGASIGVLRVLTYRTK